MILVDTSVWIDHLRQHDATLANLLDTGQVVAHPCVIGELALGNLKHRDRVLDALQGLPQASAVSDRELLYFVTHHKLAGLGIGYVDAHLLASARLGHLTVWTRDKRFHDVASRLDLAAHLPGQ